MGFDRGPTGRRLVLPARLTPPKALGCAGLNPTMTAADADLTLQGATLPDLLHPSAMRRIDQANAEPVIVMAFAGGNSGGLFADLLKRATFAPSTFRAEAFAEDLFVRNFVGECFRVSVGGAHPTLVTEHLLRLLTAPPTDAAVVDFRRQIIWELSQSPGLRRKFEELYLGLGRLRTVLEGTSAGFGGDSNRRQLSVLEGFADVVELMTQGFATAQSGLQRLSAFGTAVRNSEAFRSLVELLRYDEGMAAVEFRVGIGADGRVRKLELLKVDEAKENAFVNPPWRRWLAKLELFGRGFAFGDGEVMARLLDAVFEGIAPTLPLLVQLLGDMEFYLGGLSFADRAAAAGLPVCLPDIVTAGQPRRISGLFNPLLLSQGKPVPCDIEIDRHDATVLITGPNSGGKTRLLQALGLSQLLAQVGLFVPAHSAQMVLAPSLVVSLIQETRFDQSEGRLGMELMRIRGLFESLPSGAMVILDELCSGTNPSEGEEIFELVLRMLSILRPQAFITTHFLDFAARLQQRRQIDGLRFLQVALGPQQEPTYQFAEGVAQTSLASHAAARLGVTGDQLMALIEANLNRESAPLSRGNNIH